VLPAKEDDLDKRARLGRKCVKILIRGGGGVVPVGKVWEAGHEWGECEGVKTIRNVEKQASPGRGPRPRESRS